MIRMKARSILLSIMLLVASCVFFACKQSTEIKVESIAFTEQSISLLVGEEYAPNVKVLPSYATVRSYTLITNDTTALKIEGGTIKALKATMGVKLKVVSDDNENINDIVSVNIYNEATELDVPTELKFDGEKITFVGKDNVNSYMLKINEQEINIGNNTEYNFSDIIGKVDNLYNQIITCRVKAIGDGKIFNDSAYSNEISFIKVAGVNNAYVENEILYFDAIKNVASYTVDVVRGSQVVKTQIVNNSSFEEKQLSLNISELTDSNNGAQYLIQITPNIENYNAPNGVGVFGGEVVNLNYSIIGKVQELSIVENVLSWEFVENAQTYTIQAYKNGELIEEFLDVKSNHLQLPYKEGGEYCCKVIANSTNINITTGKEYSEPLYFTILSAPEITANNNTVSWTNIDGAEGYLVNIKDGVGGFIANQKFVLQNTYDVSAFSAGTYYIEVMACGNGENGKDVKSIISSQMSTQASWIILNKLQLEIGNEKLYWKDLDNNSLNKYRITFDDVDAILTSQDYGTQYSYDQSTNTFSYDLSSHNFEPGTYPITVQSVGESSIFDAVEDVVEIIKLPDGSITSLNYKKFTVAQVVNATEYKIEIYKAGDLSNKVLTLDNMDGYGFNLDASTLEAGNYVAKVFVYGNGTNVFDADNLNDTTTLAFEKLATPAVEIDKTNLKVIVDKNNLVKNETSYKLFENGNDLRGKFVDNQYDLSGLTAGEYIYSAQSIGDNATVLDSNITLVENVKKVKKLAKPSVNFIKDALKFEISCGADENFVEYYTMTLNDKVIPVANNVAHCSKEDINIAGSYEAKISASPLESAEYNLIIKSDIQTYLLSKLDGLCDFTISNGMLLVTPSQTLIETGYSLSLRIDNGENDIVLDGFDYSNSHFAKKLLDNNYNAIEAITSLMQGAGEYAIYTTISQNKDNVVTSNETQCINALKVLGKVTTISKNGQNIEFNSVDNASNYIAIVEVEGNEYYIDIAQSENVLTMEKLIGLMEDVGVPYLEQIPYSISFVAVSDNGYMLNNKGVDKYSFEFLKTPVISIVEQENNSKHLSIVNEDENASNYYISISQNDIIVGDKLQSKGDGENTIVDIDNLTKDTITGLPKLVAGNVKMQVISSAINGNYFDSKNSELNVIKLDTSLITISNGLLNWDQINNAKQYNLVYSNLSGKQTVVLTEGIENFTIQNGKCVYNFDTLIAGTTSLYLQVDANLKQGDTYYLNSNNSDTFDVYKMGNPSISVVAGEIYIEILNADLKLAEKVDLRVDDANGVEIMLDGEDVKVMANGIDLVTLDDDSVTVMSSADKVGISINPNLLCKYGQNELLKETLTIKAYSKDEKTLNSSITTKEVYGLLSPTNLDIATSATKTESGAIDEVIEKITWVNPTVNANHIIKYEIIINYNNTNYIFNSDICAFMMPKYCDYDANENGELDYNEDVNNNNILDDGEDINGNGELDKVEIVFGAGVYTIKVRALTDNNEQYVNSNYCDEITVTILETPNNLAVKDGNVIWSTDTNVGYYLLKVYLLENDENGVLTKQLIVSSQSSVSEFDLTKLKPFETGVYGITVQAMHDASRVLSSKESVIFEVIRLPQVAEYYIKDGELHFRIHKLFSGAEIYLTDKESGTIITKLPNLNADTFVENLYEYSNVNGYNKWSESNIIDTYTDDDYFVDITYMSEQDSTLRQILAEDYSVGVKLLGSTYSSTDPTLHCIGGIISGHIGYPSNKYLESIDAKDKNIVEKLVTPITQVSETERGTVLVSIPNGLNYNLKYYINGENSLQGVHLYEVSISTDDTYKLYVAEIVDNDKFTASLTSVGSELIQDSADKNYLKHFEYNNITFNVIDKNANGYVAFNFNTSNYYYYEPINEETKGPGGYSYIDLTKGGSFVVNVRFMGDDTIYANSNVTENATIKRYNVLNLTISNGVMSWLNQATVDDNPIYLITLTATNENYNLVLYNPNIEYETGKKYTEEYLLTCLDSTKTYIFDTISYVVSEETRDEVITYKGLADIVDKIRQSNGGEVGLGGAFLATIKAHYTDMSSNDIILAQGAESKTIAILPQAQLSVSNGNLTWNMSYVTNTGGKEYITNYLLQVFNGADKLYELTLSSSMYNVSNNIATYYLPQVINNGSDSTFIFTSGSNYTFNLIALGGDSGTYINSVATTTGEINLLPQLQDVRMENGLLTWTNNTTNSVEIYISYKVGDTTVVFTTLASSNSFKLPTSFDDINGTTRYFVEGNNYYIRARLKGQTTTLNGFYNDEFGGIIDEGNKIITSRLATIDNSSIITNSGVLTWEVNELEGVTYTVVYTLEDGTTHSTEMLDTNAFNFEGIASGKIKVKAFAHHNSHFTSFGSDTNERGAEDTNRLVEVFKLDAVSEKSIKYHAGSTIISWDKVQDMDGNYIENYRVSVQQSGAETKEYNCYKTETIDSNQWIITGVIGTSFSIAVKAISVESCGKIINGDYTKYCSMEIPEQVDVSTFVFDEDEQAFKWKAIAGEQESDAYYIGYNYYDTILSGESAKAPTQIAEIEVTEYKDIDGERYYYYYPSVIGSYRLIYVQVKRAESLSSQPTYCMGDDGTYDLNFDIFASGDGTGGNPYIINKETHLRNIKYFLGANYELDNDIELTGSNVITNSAQIFTGKISGNNHSITGSSNDLTTIFDESGYVGLFARIQGATFSNIILTGFNLQGVINSQTTYLGVLAGKAEGRLLTGGGIVKSVFQNVTITSSTIQITKNTREGYTANNSNIYVGAIAGYAENTNFTGCVVSLGGSGANIKAVIEGNLQTKFAVGGIAGFAENSQFVNNSSNGNKAYALSTQLTVAEGSSVAPVVYAGALIGEIGSAGATVNDANSCTAERILANSTEEIAIIGKKI